MTEKMIPGRRRFLQAFAALPLAGVVGGKMVAAEIAKAAGGPGVMGTMGAVPSTGYDLPSTASMSPLSTLRDLIGRRSKLSADIKERHGDYSSNPWMNVNALRSISPAARNVIMHRMQIEHDIRRETRWMDRQIAHLREQVDPMDLMSLVDAA